MKRNRWVAVTAACSVAAVGASFGLGTLVESPWEEAVANSQRDPFVTEPVEKRTLAADVPEIEGSFSAGREVNVAGPVLEVPGVVTAQTVEKGDTVGSGTVLGEVSGRPVIGLVTPFRLYRDLAPGDEGPDVEALQDALRDLGVYRGDSDGQYGAGTASAVKTLYSRVGYTVPLDQELTEAVKAAEEELAQARDVEQSVRAATGTSTADTQPAEAAGAVAGEDPAGDSTSEAREAVTQAQESLAEARFAALTPLRAGEIALLPMTEATVLSAAEVGTELSGGGGGGSDDDPFEGDEGGVMSSAGGGDLVRLRIGAPSVQVRVGVASKEAYQDGTEVEVRAITDQAKKAMATVKSVSEFRQPNSETVGGLPGYDVTLVFSGEKPPFSDGDTVIVATTAQAATKAEGLSVPLIALREDEDGAFVTVVGRGRVAAEVIATGDGYAVIEAEGLTDDDDVVISGTATTGEGKGE